MSTSEPITYDILRVLGKWAQIGTNSPAIRRGLLRYFSSLHQKAVLPDCAEVATFHLLVYRLGHRTRFRAASPETVWDTDSEPRALCMLRTLFGKYFWTRETNHVLYEGTALADAAGGHLLLGPPDLQAALTTSLISQGWTYSGAIGVIELPTQNLCSLALPMLVSDRCVRAFKSLQARLTAEDEWGYADNAIRLWVLDPCRMLGAGISPPVPIASIVLLSSCSSGLSKLRKMPTEEAMQLLVAEAINIAYHHDKEAVIKCLHGIALKPGAVKHLHIAGIEQAANLMASDSSPKSGDT